MRAEDGLESWLTSSLHHRKHRLFNEHLIHRYISQLKGGTILILNILYLTYLNNLILNDNFKETI